jgi:cation diffusion facilitator family transporter
MKPSTLPPPDSAYSKQRFAMNLSLGVGGAMLFIKTGAYFLTGSSAILSDAAESVVHVGAVGFAAFSLWYSHHPADRDHPYGHERISFFSAGAEGALIVTAALFIFFEAIPRLLKPLPPTSLDLGVALVAFAGFLNGVLGAYLIRTGRRHDSLILIANGKHVLTDTWTSLGVVIGLILVLLTGWNLLDPLMAILVASNILFSGIGLMKESTQGLMDRADPEKDAAIRNILDEAKEQGLCSYHELRHRNTGRTFWVEAHLLFPGDVSVRDAHRTATAVEKRIRDAIGGVAIVTTHLEPRENHEEEHRKAIAH